MKAITKLGGFAYGLALAVVALDQAVKYWVVHIAQLPLRPSQPLIWPVQLSYVQNFGVSFGLFQGEASIVRWGLTAFSLIVSAWLIHLARKPESRLTALGLGLIIGGAVGNAIDRARLGYVIDFIDVQKLGFFPWVFNVADSAITVGVISWLVVELLRREQPA